MFVCVHTFWKNGVEPTKPIWKNKARGGFGFEMLFAVRNRELHPPQAGIVVVVHGGT